jgi:hypothetical protein
MARVASLADLARDRLYRHVTTPMTKENPITERTVDVSYIGYAEEIANLLYRFVDGWTDPCFTPFLLWVFLANFSIPLLDEVFRQLLNKMKK